MKGKKGKKNGPVTQEVQTVGQYAIEKIVGKKIDKVTGVVYYKIKWVGYPKSVNSWEPTSHLSTCMLTVEQYEDKLEQNKLKREIRKRASEDTSVLPFDPEEFFPEEKIKKSPPPQIKSSTTPTKSSGKKSRLIPTKSPGEKSFEKKFSIEQERMKKSPASTKSSNISTKSCEKKSSGKKFSREMKEMKVFPLPPKKSSLIPIKSSVKKSCGKKSWRELEEGEEIESDDDGSVTIFFKKAGVTCKLSRETLRRIKYQYLC